MKLRSYQRQAIDDLYTWFRKHDEGNPCIVLPTGAGKSVVLASICMEAVKTWPGTRILMLTHVKEIVEQNTAKLKANWPNAPLGIYAASLRRRDTNNAIIYAQVQSVHRKAQMLGRFDLVIVDECHRIGHRQQGGYRTLLADLKAINPALRVVGLTATPYRLGHGMITDAPAIFNDLIEPVTIEQLVHDGYLSPLRSKVTEMRLDVSGVKQRGGEYINKQLQAAVDIADRNQAAAREIVARGQDRKAWLIFCSGVDHAEHMRDELRALGVTCETVTGNMGRRQREQLLQDFEAGKIRALTNCDILTTGYDYPGIDLIAMLRPTGSPGLYMQISGRGMRIAPGKQDCLVLDFAGNIDRHGPITRVTPPPRPGERKGEAPVKECPQCGEIVHASAKHCPDCDYEFPAAPPKPFELSHADIMGIENEDMTVTDWQWTKHTSRKSGKQMLKVKYYGGLTDPVVTEYITVLHDGYAGRRAVRQLAEMAGNAGVRLQDIGEELDDVAKAMENGAIPGAIEYRREGKFYRVMRRIWGK